MTARGGRRAAPKGPRKRGSAAGDDPAAGGAATAIPGETWWLSGLLAAAFGVRVFATWGTFLTPDEALHVAIARSSDLATVYRLTTEQAHPPLYFFFLHLWSGVVSSDFGLRLPSILMAVATVAFLFCWVRRRAGSAAAFAAAALFAFSPSVVDLTSEIREYSLLLLFSSAALVAASPAGSLPAGRRFAATAGLLLGASATHYSGLLFSAALVASLFVELWRSGAARRTWLAFGALVLSVSAAGAVLWASHVTALLGGHLETEAKSGWLRPFYWQHGTGLASFLASSAAGVYTFLVGIPVASGLAALVALGALAIKGRRDPATAVLLAAPFVVAAGAAAFRVYPFGASRHSAWLLPTASAALCLPLAAVRPAASRWVLAALAALLPFWAQYAFRSTLSAIPRADRRQEQLDGLLSTLTARVTPSDVVFLDLQTDSLLRRYLGGGPVGESGSDAQVRRETLGHMNVWVSRTWLHDASTFVRELPVLRETAGLERGRRIWVVNGGSASRLLPQLAAAYPRAPVTSPAGFGNSLWVFQIALP